MDVGAGTIKSPGCGGMDGAGAGALLEVVCCRSFC